MFLPMMGANVTEFTSWNVTECVGAYHDEQFSSMLTSQIDALEVGETRYRLVRPVQLYRTPGPEGWVCYVNGLNGYAGHGSEPQQAFDELKLQIHRDFQTLLRKRPFEMDEREQSKWIELTGVIDLLYYKTTTPMTTNEIGQVNFDKIARPHSIKWISGERYEIEWDRVPDDLASCRPSQWIEAVVQRDPISHRILRISSVHRISFRLPSEAELRLLWESMPKAQLETTEWAW